MRCIYGIFRVGPNRMTVYTPYPQYAVYPVPYLIFLEPSSRRDSVPSGWGIGQGLDFDYKGYLRVRGGSRINGRFGFGEVGSPDPVSVAGHPKV
jgi:hypothetical protein